MTIDEYYNIMAELNCAIIEADLPCDCKAFTLKNGIDYAIYLNNNFNSEILKVALDHEIDHIKRSHFNDDLPLYAKENI